MPVDPAERTQVFLYTTRAERAAAAAAAEGWPPRSARAWGFGPGGEPLSLWEVTVESAPAGPPEVAVARQRGPLTTAEMLWAARELATDYATLKGTRDLACYFKELEESPRKVARSLRESLAVPGAFER